MSSSKRKSQKLGMAHGTASNRLRKKILFDLVHRTGQGDCFKCGERIVRIQDLSIEHKIPWESDMDPLGTFFDLDNIAYSHIKCNIGAPRKPKYFAQLYTIFCPNCGKQRQVTISTYQRTLRNKHSGRCRSCSHRLSR